MNGAASGTASAVVESAIAMMRIANTFRAEAGEERSEVEIGARIEGARHHSIACDSVSDQERSAQPVTRIRVVRSGSIPEGADAPIR